ncbi:MAG: 1-deoxy-D-xylulose-5-phosphate reductoisomerase [Candidatus Anoxymicrobium japonicum]|uniref:1-deoxy-D-xylulose 5-phosphate reductoisomerase n=1 Tax=Candidatus Anoxymicrobium japonicum TaxID=2013648 RepID=A0A2N3G899_9ACTN|nr:MAG: 1-deoxy-D-xylulose-5-phosphate reductoisomerase [Candidatus Anoxymicrobium japonicum]
MKTVAILGSTGSIGTQAVEVARRLHGTITVTALAAHSNGELMAEQARVLGARRAALSSPDAATRFAGVFREIGVELLAGPQGVVELVESGKHDLVLNSIVGSAGLAPTLAVLDKGTTLALANKESLVAGGALVLDAARASGARIIPVDSEHSAIFQCLQGEDREGVRHIVLTASGGPFRARSSGSLDEVTPEEALVHPTWNMGPKVTIDSATLMNKGLEVLEAHHLFKIALEDIDVLIHPQSVIHSMVEMVDGSVLAHMGVPDMRIPVQYAFTYPMRAPSPADFLSLTEYGNLSFEKVDTVRFPLLRLAYDAGKSGGTYPAAMNAANEEAVAAFLSRRIGFKGIACVVGDALERHEPLEGKTLDEIEDAEARSRRLALDVIKELENKV